MNTKVKSILARYGSIKETGYNDEDPMGLNDITKALKSIGITAVDTQGQLRPFGEVIDEVGAKFNGLNRNTQAYVATAIGGSFQSNRLLTLLTSYPEALTNVEKAYNATGSAQAKFDIYLESNEAKLNKFKATMEELFINTINSGTIGSLLDFATGFVQFANNVDLLKIAMMGLISYGFQALIPAIMASIAPMGALAGETVIATGAFAKLNAVILANPYVILAVAITGAIILLNKQKSATEQLIEASNKNIESLEKESESSVELSKSIEKLSEKQNRTYEESVKLKEAKAELIKIYPELKNIIESETTKQGELEGAIRKVTSARAEDSKEALKQQRYNLALDRNRYVLMIQDLQNRLKTTVDVGTQTSITGEINANKNVLESINTQIKQLDDQKKLIDSFKEKVVNPKKPDIYVAGEESGTKTTKDKKTSTSTPSIIQSIDLEKERYASLTMALNSVNNELERNKSLQEKDIDLASLNKLREDEISILKKKQVAIQNLTKEQQKERDELVKSLNKQGISFSGKGDSAKALNAEKTLNGLIEKMNALKGKSDKASTQMFAGLQSRYKTVKAEFDRFAQLQFTDIPKLELDYESLDGVINKVATSISTDLTEASEKATKAQEKATEDYVKEAQKMYEELWGYIIDQEEERMRIYKRDSKKRISDLDSELKSLEDRYDEANKKLEKDDINKKITELISERNMRSIEGSIDANSRIYEIDKELVDLNKQLAEKERRDIYDKEKKVLENKKEVINSELDLEEEKSQEKLRMYREYANQKVFLEEGAMNSTIAMLATFDEKFKKDGDTKGKAWLDAFLAKVALANNYFGGYIGSGNPNPGSTEGGGGGTGGGNPTAGVTQYETGGVNTYTGLAKLDGTKSLPEVVLNPSQVSNISSRLGMSGSPSQMAQQLYNTAKSGVNNAMQGASVAIHQTINAVINNGMDATTLSKAVATETSRELVRSGVRL